MSEAGLISAFLEMTPGAQGIWLFGSILVSGQLLKWFHGWLAFRKLSIEEKQARREGFTAEVELLTKQLGRAHERLSALQGRYDALQNAHDEYRDLCRAETDQLRAQIVRLENDVAALHRRQDSASVAAAHNLDAEQAPHAAASAERVQRIIDNRADNAD